MTQSAAEKREKAAERKRRQREREAEETKQGVSLSTEQRALVREWHDEDLTWAKELDDSGKFYKSECRPTMDLLAFFEGNSVVEEDEETESQKKTTRPNPSILPISIYAIERDSGSSLFPEYGLHINPSHPDYKKVFEVDGLIRFRQWLDLRDKARKNLFWLARLLKRTFYYETHKMLCDMFVQKNFDGLYFKDFDRDDLNGMLGKQERFTEDGTPTREMMLFAPRSGYKSTTDGIDTVQWMLNCPDIRILIISAFRKLSSQFRREIKGYFYLPPRAKPTPFQLLFPEYILTGVDGRSKEDIFCPAETFHSKEPHVWFSSIESSVTGQRCDIRKMDDIVDPKNSNNEDLRDGLKSEIDGTDDIVEPTGFTDIIGTRYFTTDFYGARMSPTDTGEIAPFKYLCISSWGPTPEFANEWERMGLWENPKAITKEMFDNGQAILWFPSRLSFKYLKNLLKKKGYRSFQNQQQNIATDPIEDTSFVVHFEEAAIDKATYNDSAAPKPGSPGTRLVITVDWAYSERTTADYSVMTAQIIKTREDGTQEDHVLEVEYDKWKSSQLSTNLVLFLRKWGQTGALDTVIIEKALGADLLKESMEANARKFGCLDLLQKIIWREPSNEANAKANRIKGLEILLSAERLFFCSGPWMPELKKQFCRFTGEIKQGRKDDIPDAVSFITFCLSKATLNAVNITYEEQQRMIEEEREEAQRLANYQRVFGSQYGAVPKGAPEKGEGVQYNTPAPTWREMLNGRQPSPPPSLPAPPSESDPRRALMGRFLPAGMIR